MGCYPSGSISNHGNCGSTCRMHVTWERDAIHGDRRVFEEGVVGGSRKGIVCECVD
jgi:hypothetical protein